MAEAPPSAFGQKRLHIGHEIFQPIMVQPVAGIVIFDQPRVPEQRQPPILRGLGMKVSLPWKNRIGQATARQIASTSSGGKSLSARCSGAGRTSS
jgi:hypothetical protein